MNPACRLLVLLALMLAVRLSAAADHPSTIGAETVFFQSDGRTLGGLLYKPEGAGPFPAYLYNHGSAAGNLSGQAFGQLGPLFASRGWVFFAPYRRGQGLSMHAGPYISDEIAAAGQEARRRVFPVLAGGTIALLALAVAVTRRRATWVRLSSVAATSSLALVAFFLVVASARAHTAVHLLETGHLDDHLAARAWLESQSFVQPGRIATGGNSFGGIVTVLSTERFPYCAAVDAAGGAESWWLAPPLRERMRRAVRNSRAPIFFFQAGNDYSLAPSRALSAEMQRAGKVFELKIYPAFGASSADGHNFAWRGSAIWGPDVFRFLEAHCG